MTGVKTIRVIAKLASMVTIEEQKLCRALRDSGMKLFIPDLGKLLNRW